MRKFWVFSFFFLAALGTRAEEWRRLSAALHIQSVVSPRGTVSLPAVVGLAKQKGIDVLIPTDHFLSRYEYGIPPLEGLFRMTVHQRDVFRFGTAKYDATLRKLEVFNPGLLVLPGVETHAHYYWTGHPAKKNLTIHDSQRHFLIFGLSPEDVDLLPVTSNPKVGTFPWDRIVLPALLAALGGAIMIRWPAGLLVVVLGLLWGVNQRPFRRLPDPPGPHGHEQRLIDFVRERNGLIVWAHPEAQEFAEPRKAYRGTYVQTLPYPEAVLETDGAAGFGYFWEGDRVVGVPGGQWDRTSRDYLEGRRKFPLWAFGELDWNQEGRSGITLDKIQNVVWVREPTREAVLDAFRRGRFYVLDKSKDPPLVLERWELESGGKTAMSGESLPWSDGARLRLGLSGGGGPVTVTVLKNGAEWKTLGGASPLRQDLLLSPVSPEGDFYRIVVRAPAGTLVSNPLFLRRASPDRI